MEVLIAIKDSITFKELPNMHRRYLFLICELNHSLYTLVNIHAPNSNQDYFLTPLLSNYYLKLHKGHTLLV